MGGIGSVSANNNGDTVAPTGSFGTVGSVTLPDLPQAFLLAVMGGIESAIAGNAAPGSAPAVWLTHALAAVDGRSLTQVELDVIVAAARTRGNRDPLQDWNTVFTPNAAQLSNSPMALEPTCHLAVVDSDLRRYCERKPLSAAK
jgi:hypothetical protein